MLREKMISGEYLPGTRIDPDKLADTLHMSRTPVREALLRLKYEGIIEILPKQGVFVIPLSIVDLREIYELLTALEIEALTLIFRRRMTKSELKPLFDAVDGMAACLEQEDREGWNHADEAFHRELLRLCGNARISTLGLDNRDIVQRGHFVALRLLSDEEKSSSIRAHRKTLELLLGDDEIELLTSHYRQRLTSEERLLQKVENHRIISL